jgi:hypothetical protein
MTQISPPWVFAGPSLPPSLRSPAHDVVWRPPAIAGDALEALEARPRAVVLIDGLFDQRPAIRHKELLSLIEAGVPVVGGASMGALRAAEMHMLGMIGVGRIFQAYASGRIAGDDEVAVLHGPAEMDWAPLTIALVNVRATLCSAVRHGVMAAASARRLRSCAAGVFFQDRTWRLVLELARSGAVAPGPELDHFESWLPDGFVDQKRLDALQCLVTAAALPATGLPDRKPQAPTTFTQALARQVSRGLKPSLGAS